MSQTTYSFDPGVARPGQIADSGDVDVITAVSTVDIPVGRFLKDAGLASDGKTQLVTLPSANAGTDKLLGVSLHTHAIESDPAATYPVIKAGKPINVLRKGRVFVSADEGFDPATDTAFVRFTANGVNSQPGMVRNDDDTGKADELDASGYLVRHRVLLKTTAAGVVPIEINLPS